MRDSVTSRPLLVSSWRAGATPGGATRTAPSPPVHRPFRKGARDCAGGSSRPTMTSLLFKLMLQLVASVLLACALLLAAVAAWI
jgi:hypothetical protein